jgi:hypothetical protein
MESNFSTESTPQRNIPLRGNLWVLIIQGSGKRDPCEDHMTHSHFANPWKLFLFKASVYVLGVRIPGVSGLFVPIRHVSPCGPCTTGYPRRSGTGDAFSYLASQNLAGKQH